MALMFKSIVNSMERLQQLHKTKK